MEFSITLLIVVGTGYLLDLWLGDPQGWPHPVSFFGKLIAHGEKRFNNGSHRRLIGALMTIVLVVSTWCLLFLFFNLIQDVDWLAIPLGIVFFFWGLASTSLIREGRTVWRTLDEEGLVAGRERLRFIVGRDTAALNKNQVRTAVLETLSENLSDGVVAPLFYFALGGLPLMFAYKMVNTLDSMIGYKSERYLQFGSFAARLDDVLNYLPARITGLLMSFLSMNIGGFRFMKRFGRNHASPNSAMPEAALAGILNCRFGGPNIYHGELVVKPFIGENTRLLVADDLKRTVRINQGVCFVMTIIAVLLQLKIGRF